MTQGEYEDYSIKGVFSSEEKAENVRKFLCRYDSSVSVFPMELDELNFDTTKTIFEVEFDNGILSRINEANCIPYNYFFNGNKDWGIIFVMAVDEEHAKTIACDIRAKSLSEKENI